MSEVAQNRSRDCADESVDWIQESCRPLVHVWDHLVEDVVEPDDHYLRRHSFLPGP